MQTITLHETVGEDGTLRLQVPSLPRGAQIEVVVVLQTPNNGSENSATPSRSVMDFAGIITDETFDAPEELPLGPIVELE